jgi:hypothetical protein
MNFYDGVFTIPESDRFANAVKTVQEARQLAIRTAEQPPVDDGLTRRFVAKITREDGPAYRVLSVLTDRTGVPR